MIAEGTSGQEIVFTSIHDDSFGAGGTFDTSSNGTTSGTPEDWGGLLLRQLSSASLDHVQIAYAGGSTEMEGTTAKNNAIEVPPGQFAADQQRAGEQCFRSGHRKS